VTSDIMIHNQQRNVERRAEIARRAYELYLERGCRDGQDLDDWLIAERELLEKLPQTQPNQADGAAISREGKGSTSIRARRRNTANPEKMTKQ
jgi:hypothetical protein